MNKMELVYDSNTVKQFICRGRDELSIVAVKDSLNGEWNWSGSHIYCGEYWEMEPEELQQRTQEISRFFHSVL